MPNPTTIVIFGASGDLTRRKLVPALFRLYCKGRLPAGCRIVGFARRPYGPEGFRKRMRAGLNEFARGRFSEAQWEAFAPQLDYVQGNLGQVQDFAALDAALVPHETGVTNRLYYFATPPRFYADIVGHLGANNMTREKGGWRRVVIEKPFGHDLTSAQELNRAVHAVLDEHQIYRIDHYLGKETVQNLLVFRFANTIYEPVWNRNYIDNVQITVAEAVDVGHRAGYYDSVGVLRDMFQNHLLQLLTLVSMEPPASFEADALRNEKVKVLSAIRPIPPHAVAEHTVRGQYRGYRETEGAAPDSQTATYAALRLFVDNWRWQSVPFYLRSGKALKRKTSEIIIQFRRPPHVMFPLPEGTQITANVLSVCVQPDEGIHFEFEAKVPDTVAGMRTVAMEFHYADSFGPAAIPEAYERLLLDALNGDASLFTRGDSIELAWGLMDPILECWASPAAPPLAFYDRGGWGPTEADEFLARDGRRWLRGCGEHD